MCGIVGHYKFRSHSETDKRKFSHMTESLLTEALTINQFGIVKSKIGPRPYKIIYSGSFKCW